MAGVPLPTAKKLMGHAEISTTLLYPHLSDEHKREPVSRLTMAKCKAEERIIAFGASGGEGRG